MEIEYGENNSWPKTVSVTFVDRSGENVVFFNTTNMVSVVGENYEIPKDYIFDFNFSKKEFEDSVCRLADKIRLDRHLGNFRIIGSWDAGGNTDEFRELINRFVGIIDKLVGRL